MKIYPIKFFIYTKKMIPNQKHLFSIADDTTYLNAAYMGPLLKEAEAAGIDGLSRKNNPSNIKPNDFFEDPKIVKTLFSKLIDAKPENIAILPSASYGLSIAVNNIDPLIGSHILMVEDEFPSIYYTVHAWCKAKEKQIKIISKPTASKQTAADWNEQLLASINKDTIALVMSPIHWMDGTLFSIEAISKRCKETNTLFIVDGTQYIGAYAFSLNEVPVDALICAAYKWLLGPYTSGLAYFSEAFLMGMPLEQSWMTRINANDFSSITQYSEQYMPDAGRFDMGQFSNFINIPILKVSLAQLLAWTPAAIQNYTKSISASFITQVQEMGLGVEEEAYRAAHLFSIKGLEKTQAISLSQKLQAAKVYVSVRGNSLRISPHVYNDENDFEKLKVLLAVAL